MLTCSSQHNGAPSSFRGSRTSSRSRAPSNPASPRSTSQPDLGSFSPASPSSRSHSRSRSHPQPQFLPMGFAGSSSVYGSPGSPGFHGPPSPTDLDFEDSFSKSISSLPMPVRHSCDSDTDSDDAGDDSTLGLVLDRSTTSSTVSLAPQDRLDALQRTNAEMGKKLMEAERTLQKRLSEHEMELEEMQSRLEESKSELSATKREEKELRAKEVTLPLKIVPVVLTLHLRISVRTRRRLLRLNRRLQSCRRAWTMPAHRTRVSRNNTWNNVVSRVDLSPLFAVKSSRFCTFQPSLSDTATLYAYVTKRSRISRTAPRCSKLKLKNGRESERRARIGSRTSRQSSRSRSRRMCCWMSRR
jgi:hypothetical protein